MNDLTLAETNYEDEVDKIILQNKKDIWKDKQLSDLIDDYFDNSLLALDFCSALGDCLTRVGHLNSFINAAFRNFEEEHHTVVGEEASGKDYSRTLEELRKFRMVGDPFTQDFFEVFNSIYTHQLSLLERLRRKSQKLGHKLRRALTMVSNMVFVAGNPLRKKNERDLRRMEIMDSMQIGVYVVVMDLDVVRMLAERFQTEIEIEALLAIADSAILRGGDAVGIAVEVIKRKVDGFKEMNHDLTEHVLLCTSSLRRGRRLTWETVVLFSS